MLNINTKNIYQKISSNNYLSNSYIHLITVKIVHFILITIEILLNIIQELDIFLTKFNNNEQSRNILRFIALITSKYNELPKVIQIIILAFYIIICDFLYLFLKKKIFRKERIYISFIINILELFYFRVFMLIFLNLFFSFNDIYLIILLILFLPHLYLIINHFVYNHLYYFVPPFIDYPYDTFSSLFDIVLFFIKMLLSICYSLNYRAQILFFFIILFLTQIVFSIYFLEKSINHSYLFMKNEFLNRTRVSLFIFQSIVIIFALFIGRKEIISIFFIIIFGCLLIIVNAFIFVIYNPFSCITIHRDTTLENIIYYLYIISYKDDVDFIFVNKLNEHYEKCGICDLCNNYLRYIKNYEQKFDKNEENESFVEEDKNDNKNELDDLLSLIYDGKNQYFNLINNLIVNYKIKNIEYYKNYSHYYINFNYLMYIGYMKKNITLSLNEKLILDKINQENNLSIEKHQIQIKTLLLSNEFINVGKKVINILKEILNTEYNYNKAKSLLNLSFLLNKMKDNKYKNNLLGQKVGGNNNTKNLIAACTIIYEEIFNIKINNSQLPLIDNIPQLEDIFYNNSKNDKIISLSFNLNNNDCKIIRAGKDLYSYVNYNLFDIFPLAFKEYQKNHFLSTIFNSFDISLNKDIKKYISLNVKKKTLSKSENIRIVKQKIKKDNKSKYVEIKLILCKNILSKIYYQLLTLKITPLFNNSNSYYILFDGFYYIDKYSIITNIDLKNNQDLEEKICGVSDSELEGNLDIYSFTLKKYIRWQNNLGYIMKKILTFNISNKLYNIYILTHKQKEMKKSVYRNISYLNVENIFESDEGKDELKSSQKNDSHIDKNLYVDNASSTISQNVNSYRDFSSKALINKKKDKLDENKDFNKFTNLIYIVIFIIIIIFVVEIIHLKKLELNLINYNESFISYRKFISYYFQLFPITFFHICIKLNLEEEGCRNLVIYYCEDYYKTYPNIDYDINAFLYIQGERISTKIMEERAILTKINTIMGEKKYDDFFGKTINYTRLTQTFINGYIKFDLSKVKIIFNEAIMIMINAFNTIYTTNYSNSFIYLLDKPIQSFNFINNIKIDKELYDYQKDMYELILNYKIFVNQFNAINKEIQNLIYKTSKIFQIFIYVYLHLNIILILLVGVLFIFYINSFGNIIVNIINMINVTMNSKSDKFIFKEMFLEKLENLEIILEIYNGDPIQAIHNLNNLYNDYQQYLTTKNKNDAMGLAKKGYRNLINEEKKKNEINIPKNQRIINKSQIKHLHFVKQNLIVIFLLIIICIIIYITLLILWINFFDIKKQLHSLFEKNNNLETTIYRAINTYSLMILNNFTLSEIAKNIYNDIYNYEEPFSILKSFYNNLEYGYNSQKEKDKLGDLYEVFDKTKTFTCKALYTQSEEIFKEMDKTPSSMKLPKIKEKLVNQCVNARMDETFDSNVLFERHFQYINNAILSINSHTYNELIDHLKTGLIGKISFVFVNVIIYLCEILFHLPNKITKDNVLKVLHKNLVITIFLFITFLIAIIISLYFLISKIKKYYERIISLKNVFKLIEVQE